MSKIHDALKKIQQERMSAPPTPPSTLIVQDDRHTPGNQNPSPVTERREQVADVEVPLSLHEIIPPLAPNPIGPKKDNLHGRPAESVLRQEDLELQCVQASWHIDSNRIVFCENNSSALGAEQFRTLRARLLRMRDNQTLKKLHITSAVSGEGKTFVATNLAQAFSRQGSKRVLLIDGDLRNPGVHLPIGAPLAPGLSDYLRGDVQEAAIVQHGLESSLYLIAAGNAVKNPSELLSNGKLKTLLDRLAPSFDWVIIDSPPCLPVADASLISALSDGVVLVVRAASTPSELSQRAQQELKGRNIVGVVLNLAETAGAYYGYYKYGYGDYGSKSAGQTPS